MVGVGEGCGGDGDLAARVRRRTYMWPQRVRRVGRGVAGVRETGRLRFARQVG